MRRFSTLGTLMVLTLVFTAIVGALELRRHWLVAALNARRNVPSFAADLTREGQKESTSPGNIPSARLRMRFDDPATAAAQREVRALEQRAEQRRAEIVAQSKQRMATTFAVDPAHHDPEQGFVMIESFQNVGRATPGAAFQTVVWAALKGDEATLTQGLTLDDRARARAEVLIARQPEASRQQLTPEKLAALWLEEAVIDVAAAQIISQTRLDDTHVNLLLRGGIAPGHTLTMRQTDSGWQLVVPEAGLESVQKKVIGSSPPLK